MKVNSWQAFSVSLLTTLLWCNSIASLAWYRYPATKMKLFRPDAPLLTSGEMYFFYPLITAWMMLVCYIVCIATFALLWEKE